MKKRQEVISISDSESSEISTVCKITDEDVVINNSGKNRRQKQSDEDSVVKIALSSDSSVQPVPVTLDYRVMKNSFSCLDKKIQDSPNTKVSAWLDDNIDNLLNTPRRDYLSTRNENDLVKFKRECLTAAEKRNLTGRDVLTRKQNSGILIRRHNKTVNKNIFDINCNRPSTSHVVTNLHHCNTIYIESDSGSNSPKIVNPKENSVVQSEIQQCKVPSHHDVQKKEFTNYLQLMNTGSAVPRILNSEQGQNRRYTRARNLALLNQKRALDKQHQEEVEVQINLDGTNSSLSTNCCNIINTNGNSQDFIQHEPRSICVGPSFIKSSMEDLSKASKAINRSLHINNSTDSNHLYNFGSGIDAWFNERIVQVPEITSTSIAPTTANLHQAISTIANIEELTENNVQNTLNDNNYNSETLNLGMCPENVSVSHNTNTCDQIETCVSIISSLSGSGHEKRLIDTAVTNTGKTEKSVQDASKKRTITEIHKYRNQKSPLLRECLDVRRRKRQRFAISERKKHSRNVLRLNRLKSSGKLGKVKLKSHVFVKKRKMTKKILRTCEEQELLKLSSKPFSRTYLIQPECRSTPNRKGADLKFYESNFLFSGLTPEHRVALMEREKILDKPTSSPVAQDYVCIGFNPTDISLSLNNMEKIKSVVNYRENWLYRQNPNNERYTTEDLEVSQLMEKSLNKAIGSNISNDVYQHSSDGKQSSRVECCLRASAYPSGSSSYMSMSHSGRETDSDISSTSHSDDNEEDDKQEVITVSEIERNQCEFQELCVSDETIPRSLRDCLTKPVAKQNYLASKPLTDKKSVLLSHTIQISEDNGEVIGVCYFDINLIVIQKKIVSFWSQSPLANVLGAQNTWFPRGSINRSVLETGCIRKESPDVTIRLQDSIAYIELWTKEHKSDKRERPVADIFVVIYLILSRGETSKKVLQLENIHGYASDVQYIALRNSRNIIVSWNVMHDDVSSTIVHCYELAADYQTVVSIKQVESAAHYLSSLHNVEDSDDVVMGCGDKKITIWNFENSDYCYVVTTVDLFKMPPMRTIWAKCDRGFLFTLHELNNGIINLIAINSTASTWKCVRVYEGEPMGGRLTGVCIENGYLIACYDSGLSYWNARTGALVSNQPSSTKFFLANGGYLVAVRNNEVLVRHALRYGF